MILEKQQSLMRAHREQRGHQPILGQGAEAEVEQFRPEIQDSLTGEAHLLAKLLHQLSSQET